VKADADEMLTRAGWDKVDLHVMTKQLEKADSTAMTVILVDMYSREPVRRAALSAGENLFGRFCWFDPPRFHSVSKIGDVTAFAEKQGMDEVSNRVLMFGGTATRLFGFSPTHNMTTVKVPLFKVADRRLRISKGHHFISHSRIAGIRGVSCHFRLSADFVGRVALVCSEGNYQPGEMGMYRCYKELFESDPEFNLYDERFSIERIDDSVFVKCGFVVRG
jgi:hypothetical protein